MRLQAVVAQHQFRNVVGHYLEQRIAIRPRQAAGGDLAVQGDLDIDFVVGAIDPGRIVDEIGVDAAAGAREFDARGLGEAQVGTFADRLCLQRIGIHPDRIIGAVPGVGIAFGRRLHISADAAEPEQIDLHLQDGAEQFAGRHCVHAHGQHGLHLGRKRDGFQASCKHAAAFRNQRLVIIVPARSRQREHALAFGKGGRNTGGGIKENVAMVKGRHQRHSGRQQQPVAEHIARHVTNAGHADGLGLHVGAQFAEMPLYRNPCALGGDGHRLVVIAIAAARREGIAQPEALALGNAIGGVGKGCGALVGGDHQIRVGRIMAHHAGWRQDGAGHIQIVGDRQQRADIDAIGLGAFRQPRIAVRRRRQQLGIETALGTGWHDHGILHLLRLHQAQHFGAEVVAPVRPAQAATRNRPAAQVDALHARGEHPDLAIGDWVGQSGHGGGIDLEGHRLRPAGHEEIGPQGG